MRMARKHISWYTKGLKDSANFRHSMNMLQTIELQLSAIDEFFDHLQSRDHRLQYDVTNNPFTDNLVLEAA
jgi:tRNA-dihydrouridine synthase B